LAFLQISSLREDEFSGLASSGTLLSPHNDMNQNSFAPPISSGPLGLLTILPLNTNGDRDRQTPFSQRFRISV